MDKKVSIIIPCYNYAQYVKEAIDSAVNQTYENIEIIIVNDASTDNSKEVITEYIKNIPNAKFIDSETNGGPSHARNTAIEAAVGEYILPLDADDIIAPTYVEKAVNVIESNEKIGIVYCEAELFGTEQKKWELPKFDKESFLFSNSIFCTALFKKDTWLKAGKYNETMKLGLEDWDFWISIYELGYDVYQIPEILFRYRQHNSASLNKKAGENYDIVLKQIVNNHPKLYLNNDETIKRIFQRAENKDTLKYKKYKKLFRIFFSIAAAEFLLIIAVILCFKLAF